MDTGQLERRHRALQSARDALTNGHPEVGARECKSLLQLNPNDVEARHLLGRCFGAGGLLVEAATELQRAVAAQSNHVPALIDWGTVLVALGQHEQALRVLRQAQMLDSRSAQLHFSLGLCALNTGDLPQARHEFQAAIARNARWPDAHNNLGVTLDRLGATADAVECFRQAVAIFPDYATGHRNLGDALLRLGQVTTAVAEFRMVSALNPLAAESHSELGAALLSAGDFEAAVVALEKALSLDPHRAGAAANLGEAHRHLGQPEKAAAALQRALACDPCLLEAQLGLGLLAAARGDAAAAVAVLVPAHQQVRHRADLTLQIALNLEQLGCHAEALAILRDAAEVIPGNAEVHAALATALHRLGRVKEALASYDRSIAINPGRAQTHVHRGFALESLGCESAAIGSFDTALTLEHANLDAVAGVFSCARRVCDWPRAEASLTKLSAEPDGLDRLPAFLALSVDLELPAQTTILRRRGQSIPRPRHVHPIARFSHSRLRVAYVSPDFRDHAVAHALVGVIEHHDRQLIDLVAVSLAPPDESEVGARLRAAVGESVDASAMSDDEIVADLREREVDVAVDLAGFTTGARTGMFAKRVAPVQINYLGFPASMGVDFMDFIIADNVVVPPAHEDCYSERVLRMPNAYLPFDSTRHVPKYVPTRAAAGLPDEGFVFCGFNNGYKISREIFDLWLSLLQETRDSVLWLRAGSVDMMNNLRLAAESRGVASERLVFAGFEQRMEDHLARLQLADLFLDTLPYNAHTTGTEALWAGVPLVTCLGRTFAGRVGASILAAAGLPELVCADLSAYRALAAELSRSPRALLELKARLVAARDSAPLFDTARYTRDLETILVATCRQSVP